MTDTAKARDVAARVVAVCDLLGALVDDGPEGLETFVADVRSQWAAEMGLIRIAEAVDRMPPTVLARFDAQPWRQIVAMRSFPAHQYDDLDPRRVWRTVTRDVPSLRSYLLDVVLPQLDD